jgi:hypothetical protein
MVEFPAVWNTPASNGHPSRKEETMRISRLLALVLTAVVLTPALAGPLAPSKPSDIVTLMPDASGANGACGLATQQQRVEAVINGADGSISPFTIPDKEVLVLTGGTWEDVTAGANVNVFLELSLRTASTNNLLAATPAIRSDAAGFAAGSFTLEPGIVIKPGVSLCASFNVDGTNTLAFPRLTGFLAKDK